MSQQLTPRQLVVVFRRFWWLVLGLPLLAGLASFGLEAAQPPRYESSARVIAVRGVADESSTAGMTWAREDTVAQDLPTIISSSVFAGDVAAELAQQSPGTQPGALHAANDGKIVTITASAAQPEAAQATVAAAIRMLQANGLRYWGDPTWTPEHPGVNIGPLDAPGAAVAVPTRRQVAQDAVLRAVVAGIVACALAGGLTRLRQPAESGVAVSVSRID